MTVLITGDRKWTNRSLIRVALLTLGPGAKVVVGDAAGADTLAYQAALALGYVVTRYFADWRRYGAGAGPIRNREMFAAEKPDAVWAFHNDLASSRGTKDAVKRALDLGLPVWLYREQDPAPSRLLSLGLAVRVETVPEAPP